MTDERKWSWIVGELLVDSVILILNSFTLWLTTVSNIYTAVGYLFGMFSYGTSKLVSATKQSLNDGVIISMMPKCAACKYCFSEIRCEISKSWKK